jgi:hypothetical protein
MYLLGQFDVSKATGGSPKYNIARMSKGKVRGYIKPPGSDEASSVSMRRCGSCQVGAFEPLNLLVGRVVL